MPDQLYSRHIKRILDIIVALLLVIPLLPVYLVLAILIKLTSRGPVLFRQERSGLHGEPFTMYKFRSMAADNDVHNTASEDRHTRIGSLMRKTSLDELPQIVNVLQGHMSFVGPRPWITEYHKHLTKRQRGRANVRPGITGRAQAFGRNALSVKEKIEHDLTYVELISLREDFRVIVQTFKTIRDKSVADIGKHGIHFELAELRAQWTPQYAEVSGVLEMQDQEEQDDMIQAATVQNTTSATTSKKKALFTATVDSHILHFHIPYLKLLQDMGYEVHVATNGTGEIPHCDVRHTVSFARSPLSPDNIRAIRDLKKIIEREQFDLIHTHTPMGAVVTRLAARKARKKFGTRVIYTAHGFHFYKGAPWHFWAMFYPIEKFLARYTDVLITINKEDYNLAKRKFHTRVEYVPGVGVDPKKFDFEFTEADKQKLRKSLGLKKSDFVLIFPAELNKNKNQILLINAMEQLVKEHPDIHLLLPGQDSYNGYYQQVTAEKGLQKNIHFLGYRTDIPQLLKISDVAVSSSLREGLPVNLLEAAYVGLPIVATDCRGNRDLTPKQCTVAHNDPGRFASLVAERHQDGRTKLATRYGLEEVASKLRKLYGA